VNRLIRSLRRRVSAALRDRRNRADLHRESNELALSDLPDTIRADAVRWLARIDWRGRAPLPNPIDLLGFSVSYFEEDDLRYLFREILVEGDYLFRSQTERPTIFDCGSNVGLSVLFFKRLYPHAQITAFEPDPVTFSMLKKNVEVNQLGDVTLNNCALSDKDREITFYRDRSKSGSLRMSALIERQSGDPVRVPARRLSAFVNAPVDLLKMDIEGAEHVVLPELATSGKLASINQIHLEYHHHVVSRDDRLSEILKVLEDHGFGYQLRTPSRQWPIPQSFFFSKWPTSFAFQDLSIYCYRK
jgi:FkbM family methyltransferase